MRDDVLTVIDEPVQISGEFRIRLNPFLFQPLDREKRNQANQRTHPDFLKTTVWITNDVVEKTIFFVPQIMIPMLPHALHGGADIDIVLEELSRQTFVNRVALG